MNPVSPFKKGIRWLPHSDGDKLVQHLMPHVGKPPQIINFNELFNNSTIHLEAFWKHPNRKKNGTNVSWSSPRRRSFESKGTISASPLLNQRNPAVCTITLRWISRRNGGEDTNNCIGENTHLVILSALFGMVKTWPLQRFLVTSS